MIEIKGLKKAFAGQPVLNGIDLILSKAQTHILLGLSGCGKSTLLKHIMGLLEPDNGGLSVDGLQVKKQNISEVREKIGYVLQNAGLFPHMTSRENISLVAKLKAWPRQKTENRIDELGKLVNLHKEVLDRYPSEISGGQRQRVGLMRALMLDPPVLLLDEPLSALDPIIRHDLQAELKSIFDRLNKTVIIVTHDLNEAAYFGHSITLMNQGRIEQHGALRDLIENPASDFVHQFLKAQRPAPELAKW